MPFFDTITNTFKGFSAQTQGTGFLQGTRIGYKVAVKGGLPFVILGAGFAGATAPRGHVFSSMTANAATYPLIGIASGVIGTMLAGPLGGYVGAFASAFLVGEPIERGVASAVQSFVDFGSNMRKARYGGDYRDTQTAITMRQAAAREMSRSLLNARQWLGQEGAFMHQ